MNSEERRLKFLQNNFQNHQYDGVRNIDSLLPILNDYCVCLKAAVNRLVDIDKKELDRQQYMAHVGGECPKNLLADIIYRYRTVGNSCYEMLKDKLLESENFQYFRQQIYTSFIKLKKNCLVIISGPPLVVKRCKMSVTIGILLPEDLLKSKSVTCKIVREKENTNSDGISVMSDEKVNQEIHGYINGLPELTSAIIPLKHYTGVMGVEFKQLSIDVIEPTVANKETIRKARFHVIFECNEITVQGMSHVNQIDIIKSLPFMVSKATTYDGKLTFHQFWDMFYDDTKSTDRNKFAQGLQYIFRYITDCVRPLSDDQLDHIFNLYFNGRSRKTEVFERNVVFKEKIDNETSFSLWQGFHSVADMIAERHGTNSCKNFVKELYEMGLIYGYVSTRKLAHCLAQSRIKPIIGLRFSDHTLGGVCAMKCFVNYSTGELDWHCFDPFQNKVHIDDKRSLIDLILSCDELTDAKCIFQRDIADPNRAYLYNKFDLLKISGGPCSQPPPYRLPYRRFTIRFDSRLPKKTSSKNQIKNSLQNESSKILPNANNAQMQSNNEEEDMFPDIQVDSTMESGEMLVNNIQESQLLPLAEEDARHAFIDFQNSC